MLDFLNVTKALTDENRVRILMALRQRDLCVCQVTAFLDLAPSTTSKHLSILRQARLIESRKNGKWVYYHLAENSASQLVRDTLQLLVNNLSAHEVILRDESRMQEILAREDLLCAGMNAEEKEYMHSPEMHLLEEENNI